MKRGVLSTVVVTGLVANLLYGQFFGPGMTVFDPSVFGKNIQELAQMEQQLSQQLRTYQMINNQYNQMLWMATPVSVMSRYRAILTPWQSSTATNTYGTTGGWIVAVNTGMNAPGGYQSATEQLQPYGSALGNVPPDQLDRLQKHYATIELTDGATQSGMATIGTMRQNAPMVEVAIQGLENDSLSADPDLNTEIAVLNKINAAGVIALRNGQDSNKLLVALTEQQLIQAKRQRDAEVAAINTHIQMMGQGQQILQAQSSNWTNAMLAYRP
jgi:hypothetical protein